MGDAGAPDYGHRLLPHIVDEKARLDPQGEAFFVPHSDNPEDGWKPITWKEYANAINYTARIIIEECGSPATGVNPTIAYIGPNDGRYVVVVVAAVKAGYKALFISPRNSQEGQINLFKTTDCNFILFPESHRSTVHPWLQERDMKAIEIGSLDSWTSKNDVQHIPYEKSFAEAEWTPLVVLHTSGSTGLPKPIEVPQGMFATCDGTHNVPNWNGRRYWFRFWEEVSVKHFIPMPLFHAAALYVFLNSVIYWGTPVALGIASRPLSAEVAIDSIVHSGADSALLPAVILEEISHDPKRMKILASLKIVAFGGSHLATEAGNRLVKNGVKMSNVIGSTESFPPMVYEQPPELWNYFLVNHELSGIDWRQSEDGKTYRMVIKRKGKHPGLQGVFYVFPELDEWDTKDLFLPHPELPNNWTYYGRSDNIIVFSNGEKLNPVTIEAVVHGHPEIKGAIVVGTERFHPALILEPVKHPQSEQEAQEFIDRVWPLVVQANRDTVAHGQIARQFIMISNPDKPFPRAGKGSIQRAATVQLYKEEIDKIYEQSQALDIEVPHINVDSEEALADSIVEMFHTQLGAKGLDPDKDFFAGGVDSLQVINASRLLKYGLEAAGYEGDATAIATRVIYGNPTPRRLARYLLSAARSGGKSTDASEAEHGIQAMQSLWQKYTRDLQAPQRDARRPEALAEGQTVIITGTTGMLGSYMFDQLVRNPAVKKVVCLNRDEDGGAKRQENNMKERGLVADWTGKAEFYRAEMSRPDFGLPEGVYDRLLREADRVVHNAWPVNFNMPVDSFEPHLRGVRCVADFATLAAKRVAVAFISSIGTVENWDSAARGPVPEKRLEELSLALAGYGQSKMIGSLILEDAAKIGDFPVAVVRVGQIAGPEADAGAWNRHEWLPSIVASSARRLGALPRDLGAMDRVDWTPCERVASLVLDVLGAGADPQKVSPDDIPGYYHAVNPQATTWAELAPAVQQFYGKDRIARLVSFAEWVDLLAKSQGDTEGSGEARDLDRNPAVKLLDFYRGMAAAHEAGRSPVVFDVDRAKARSPAIRTAQAVTPELMVHWCKQWGF